MLHLRLPPIRTPILADGPRGGKPPSNSPNCRHIAQLAIEIFRLQHRFSSALLEMIPSAQLGGELADDSDRRTQAYQQQPLWRVPTKVEPPPASAAVFYDGGRMRPRIAQRRDPHRLRFPRPPLGKCSILARCPLRGALGVIEMLGYC